MKNIHLILTDKPSRLAKSTKSGLNAAKEGKGLYESNKFGITTFNIYITSEEDLILSGYHFNSKYGDEPQKTNQRDIDSRKYWEQENYYISRIVLTTDEDLIKNGVQKIDNEFLKWFIKNPSCEYVDVDKHWEIESWYRIIIPKENRKQHIIEMMKDDEKLGLYEETLENIAENYCLDKFGSKTGNKSVIDGIYFGANLMAEKMYSEEEVLNLLLTLGNILESSSRISFYTEKRIKKWFENNKK